MTLLLALITPAPAADLYWAKGGLTLQQTLDAAAPGDTVTIASDVYKGIWADPLVIPAGITLVGEGGPGSVQWYDTITIAGDDVTLRGIGIYAALGPALTVRNVSGAVVEDLLISGAKGADSGGGVLVDGADAIIRRTEIEFNQADVLGGGIAVFNSTLRIEYTHLGGNQASWGAGVFVDNVSTFTAFDSVFDANYAYQNGGGLYLDLGAVATLDGTTFIWNQVYEDEGFGAGLWSAADTLTLSGSSFASNFTTFGEGSGHAAWIDSGLVTSTATVVYDHSNPSQTAPVVVAEFASWNGAGDVFSENSGGPVGGIEGDGVITLEAPSFVANEGTDVGAIRTAGDLVVRGGLFLENSCNIFYCEGGAIRTDGPLTVTGSVFVDNSATYGGAIWAGTGGDATIRQSLFRTNLAFYAGGAVKLLDRDVDIASSRFVCNYAEGAFGGVLLERSDGSITDSTFTDNEGPYSGAAVRWDGGSPVLERNAVVGSMGSWDDGGALSFVDVEPKIYDNLLVGNESYHISTDTGMLRQTPPADIVGNQLWDPDEDGIFSPSGKWVNVNGVGGDPKLLWNPGSCQEDVWRTTVGPTDTDLDADGFDTATDCDDGDATVFPGAVETCDGVDRDCSGTVFDAAAPPTWYADFDYDGAGDPADTSVGCVRPTGYVANADDCAVNDATIGGAQTTYADTDGDGHGDPNAPSAVPSCDPGDQVYSDDDCDDTRPDVYPGAQEMCDGSVDEDCDGVVDEEGLWFIDLDSDGYGVDYSDYIEFVGECVYTQGFALVAGDCNDFLPAINPGAEELCFDDVDQDCSGAVDDNAGPTWYADDDGDGFGDLESAIRACEQPDEHVANGDDCDDAHDVVYPGALEICNDEDDDCNTTVDDVPDPLVGFADADGDGFGDADAPAEGCDAVADATDCDDSDYAINPGADEIPGNAFDEDCAAEIPTWSGGGGCATATGGGAGWLGLLAALLFRRGNASVSGRSRERGTRHE